MKKAAEREVEIAKLNDRIIPAGEFFKHFTSEEKAVMDKPLSIHYRQPSEKK